MNNFFIGLNILINRLLVLLGLRRREEHWGVVFDSLTKQPLDPVIVKLVDAKTGKMVQSSVTDLAGRFNFLAYPGKFKILVRKSNYIFPSQMLTGGKDELYGNLYHAELFELSGDSEVIPFNIPMDPEYKDWNQGAKIKILDVHPFLETFLTKLTLVAFWFVLLLSILGLYFQRAPFAKYILGAYALIFFLAWTVPRPRWWGRVLIKNPNDSLVGLVVELSHPEMKDVVVAKANVLEDGKFLIRMDRGKYVLNIKRYIDDQPPQLVYTKKVRVGGEQVVNKDFAI